MTLSLFSLSDGLISCTSGFVSVNYVYLSIGKLFSNKFYSKCTHTFNAYEYYALVCICAWDVVVYMNT